MLSPKTWHVGVIEHPKPTAPTAAAGGAGAGAGGGCVRSCNGRRCATGVRHVDSFHGCVLLTEAVAFCRCSMLAPVVKKHGLSFNALVESRAHTRAYVTLGEYAERRGRMEAEKRRNWKSGPRGWVPALSKEPVETAVSGHQIGE